MKKFHGLTSFLSFPEKLLRLPVTLPILGTLDSNIHGKTFAVTKRSAKTAKIFHSEAKAIYGIGISSVPVYRLYLCALVWKNGCSPSTGG